MLKNFPSIVDVHKGNLIKMGYKNFQEWASNEKHLYIGRNMDFYVKGATKSKYFNPYTSKKEGSVIKALTKYYNLWKDKNIDELLNYEQLGCWCHNRDDIPKSIGDCGCHGDVLLLILHEQNKI